MNLTTPRPNRTRSRGFTLVELLIVVIILGILAAVVIPQFTNATGEAKESSLRASLSTVRQAISLYRVQHNETYPGQGGWAELVTQLTTGTKADGTSGTQFGPYLRTGFPTNPMTSTATGKKGFGVRFQQLIHARGPQRLGGVDLQHDHGRTARQRGRRGAQRNRLLRPLSRRSRAGFDSSRSPS